MITFTLEETNDLIQKVKDGKSLMYFYEKMGISALAMKKFIKKHNLEYAPKPKERAGKIVITSNEVEMFFCDNSKMLSSKIIFYIKHYNLLEYDKCSKCKLDTWQGVAMPLQLHHINGRSNDQRLDNLQFLCPNCHILTPNFGAKNKNNKLKVSDEILLNAIKQYPTNPSKALHSVGLPGRGPERKRIILLQIKYGLPIYSKPPGLPRKERRENTVNDTQLLAEMCKHPNNPRRILTSVGLIPNARNFQRIYKLSCLTNIA